MGRRVTIQAETDTRISNPLQAPSGSVFPRRDLVPEECVAGGSDGLSLLGRNRSQEAFEFVGEESGWRSALGLPPEIKVLEDLSNHATLFDHTALLGTAMIWSREPDLGHFNGSTS